MNEKTHQQTCFDLPFSGLYFSVSLMEKELKHLLLNAYHDLFFF